MGMFFNCKKFLIQGFQRSLQLIHSNLKKYRRRPLLLPLLQAFESSRHYRLRKA